MVRVKTKYRKFASGGAVPLDVQIETPAAPAVEAMEAPVDDASVAFQHQIDQLRQAEAVQRQRNDEASRHAARLAEVNEILNANPDMLRNPDELVRAEKDAYAEGHEPYSPEFHRAVKRSFENSMMMKADNLSGHRPEARLAVTARQEFEPTGRSIGGMVSAPVSRETFANGSYDSYGDRPGRVTLSIAQKEAAKIAGISETDYAANVLRLRQEKADGRYGGEG